MNFSIKEDDVFRPFELKIRIETNDELIALHDVLIKSEGPLSKKICEIAAELEKYEK